MSDRASLSTHHRELMLSLAYLGGLTYALALRLLPCYSDRTLQRDLTDLRQLGDVEKHAIYKPGPKGRPVKLYDIWTLTDKGHAYIAAKANDQYPTKPAKLRHKRVMPHDLLVIKTIVALIERARQEGLSGLFVQFETRLNPAERRPIPDAVVIMQFGGGFNRQDIVPWTKDPAIEDETRSRFVIEADFQTETLSVIAGKARAYRAAFENPEWLDWWTAQYGPRPIIIWAVADKDDDPRPARQRLASIYQVWDGEWPHGYWVGTTEYWMTQEIWGVHTAGQSGWFKLTTLRTERQYVTKTERLALPAASPQPVAQPGSGASPVPVVARGPAPAAAVNIVSQASAAVANVVRPALTAAPVARPALPPDTAVVVPPGANTPFGQRAAARPVAGDRLADYPPGGYDSSSMTIRPIRAVYTPPSMLEEVQWNCARLVLLVRDGYDEVCYAVIRLVEVLGIVWIVRTSVRLVRWFFWEEGYIYVGGFVCVLVCLGMLGWIGHRVYSTYRADPRFSFSRPAPTPTAVAVIPPMPATQSRPDVSPPIPVQPTLRPMCGVARVASEGLNLRRTPGGAVLSVLHQNDEVVLLCDAQLRGATEWVHVRGGAHVGWVSKRYLNLSASPN